MPRRCPPGLAAGRQPCRAASRREPLNETAPNRNRELPRHQAGYFQTVYRNMSLMCSTIQAAGLQRCHDRRARTAVVGQASAWFQKLGYPLDSGRHNIWCRRTLPGTLRSTGGRRSPATALRSRKSSGAIRRREFGPRDLPIGVARPISAGACHGGRRSHQLLLAAAAAGVPSAPARGEGGPDTSAARFPAGRGRPPVERGVPGRVTTPR
jgi:hypothetical protein